MYDLTQEQFESDKPKLKEVISNVLNVSQDNVSLAIKQDPEGRQLDWTQTKGTSIVASVLGLNETSKDRIVEEMQPPQFGSRIGDQYEKLASVSINIVYQGPVLALTVQDGSDATNEKSTGTKI